MKHYGVKEIADELRVRQSTVSVWHSRGKLPVPSFVLAMGPVWKENRIRPWLEEKKKQKDK